MTTGRQSALEPYLADIRRGDADAMAIATDYLTDQGQELSQIATALLPAALLGYAGTPKEFTNGMPKDRLWEWLRRVQRAEGVPMGGWMRGVGSEPYITMFRWQAVRDMELPLGIRDLKRRVLGLFPEVKWTWGLALSLDATEDLLGKETTLMDFSRYVREQKGHPLDGWANSRSRLKLVLQNNGFWSHLPVEIDEGRWEFFFTQRQSAAEIIPPEPDLPKPVRGTTRFSGEFIEIDHSTT